MTAPGGLAGKSGNRSPDCDILSYTAGESGDPFAVACKPGEGPMNVETMLRGKGRAVVTIRPDETVAAALAVLRDRNIGALVVSSDGASVDGIISERDVAYGLADHGSALLSFCVAETMTRKVATCAPGDSVAELMAKMTNRRLRHLPVVDDGRLVGIVSIGDLVKSRLDEIEDEARSLRSFIASA